MNCFCGSTREYLQCCQPVISLGNAQTPEQLMRSRFSAYCNQQIEYLHQTWHPSQHADNNPQNIQAFAASVHFTQLTVLQHSDHPPSAFNQPAYRAIGSHEVGYVEFIARFIQTDKLHQLHEISRFVRENGRWYYLDGELLPAPSHKIGRNDPCPCRSGRKFKQCLSHLVAGA